MKRIFALCTLAIATACHAQIQAHPVADGNDLADSPQPQISDSPRILESTHHKVTMVPMFGATGKIRCGSNDTAFFNTSSQISEGGPFLSLTMDGQHHTIFELPSDLPSTDIVLWSVTPSGTLYVLAGNSKQFKLIHFKSDGSVAGISSIDIPYRIYPFKFAITENETLYLSGYRVTHEDALTTEDGFAALFDASGKMIRNLSSTEPRFDVKATVGTFLEGDIISGEDGKFYILGEKEITVLTQSGEIASVLPYGKPDKKSKAVWIAYSKGRLSVILFTLSDSSNGAGPVIPTMLLMNASNGDLLGKYRFAPPLTGTVLCFDAQEGYTLLSVDHSMIALDSVPIR